MNTLLRNVGQFEPGERDSVKGNGYQLQKDLS